MNAATVREAAGPIPYDVRLPEAGLGWEKVGPLFERYSVTLLGSVDAQWAEAYRRIVGADPRLRRFRLDPEHFIVSFTCRATDGPVEVMAVLKILEGLLERVNREASFAAARLSAGPDAAVEESPNSRRAGTGFRSRAASFARSALSK